LRVHDVTEMAQVCQMADAIWRKPWGIDTHALSLLW
jgi:dihydropteroate synthase